MWPNIVVNPRFVTTNTKLTWRDYKGVHTPDILDKSWLDDLASTRQYSLQLNPDGSLVQLYYDFGLRGRKLEKAAMTYIAPPPLFMGRDEESEDFTNEDLTELSKICSWLRIDYDPGASNPKIHSDCHMHISGLHSSRLALNRVPTPLQFINFLMQFHNPMSYAKMSDDDLINANSPCFEIIKNPHEIFQCYVAVPPS